jgi:hypothetical protein
VTSSHVKIAARDSEFIKNRSTLMPVLAFTTTLILIGLLGGLVFPEKINQGLDAVQSAFDADAKPTDAQVSEGLITENRYQGVQTETMYLPQDGEGLASVDKVIKHEDSVENINVSEEDVSLVLPEPIAIGMTDKEFEHFKQQLVEIPPEVNLEVTSGAVCEKCASIIYRPIL